MYERPTIIDSQRIFVVFWTCPDCGGLMPAHQQFSHSLIHREP
jgi:hypothetical protein